MAGFEPRKFTRPHRILVLHPLNAAEVHQAWATPMVAHFANLHRQGTIDAQLVGPHAGQFRALNTVKTDDFDGIVTIGLTSEQYLAELAERRLPMVVLDHKPQSAAVDSVCFNNQLAGENLAKRIASLGLREILYVSRFFRDAKPAPGADPIIEMPASAERRIGLLQGAAGSATMIWPLFPWYSGGGGILADAKTDSRWRLAHTIRQAEHWPDCIVTVDYSVAEEVVGLLAEQGLSVPRNLALATFQVFPHCDGHAPAHQLSHMQGDYLQMAEVGWRLLAARLNGGPARSAEPQSFMVDMKFADHGTLNFTPAR